MIICLCNLITHKILIIKIEVIMYTICEYIFNKLLFLIFRIKTSGDLVKIIINYNYNYKSLDRILAFFLILNINSLLKLNKNSY